MLGDAAAGRDKRKDAKTMKKVKPWNEQDMERAFMSAASSVRRHWRHRKNAEEKKPAAAQRSSRPSGR